MKYLSLTIPGTNGTPVQVDSGLPKGVPVGGLFNEQGQTTNTGTGINAIVAAIEILFLGAFLFALYTIIRGGINMITSGGEKERFAKGRERVRYAIIGLVVIFLSIFLVNLIGNFFGVPLLGKNKPVVICGHIGEVCCAGNACYVGNCSRTDNICGQ